MDCFDLRRLDRACHHGPVDWDDARFVQAVVDSLEGRNAEIPGLADTDRLTGLLNLRRARDRIAHATAQEPIGDLLFLGSGWIQADQ